MRHYLLANNAPVSPVFEWIERAAVFMEGRWPWQPSREGYLLPAIETTPQAATSSPKASVGK